MISSLPSLAISLEIGFLDSSMCVTPSSSSESLLSLETSIVLCNVSASLVSVRVSLITVVTVVLTSVVSLSKSRPTADGNVVFASAVLDVAMGSVRTAVGSKTAFCSTSIILSSTRLCCLIELISWTISTRCEDAGIALSIERRFSICWRRSVTLLLKSSSSDVSSTTFSSAEYLSKLSRFLAESFVNVNTRSLMTTK